MACAALLHDVPEDTDCDPEYLRAEFGDEVTDLVERLTAFRDGAEVPDDDRVVTLKLLDRLHAVRWFGGDRCALPRTRPGSGDVPDRAEMISLDTSAQQKNDQHDDHNDGYRPKTDKHGQVLPSPPVSRAF
jgi:hypothetical protein